MLTGVTAAEVQGTCSFYTMFKRRPCGKLVVSVCTNVTCLVTGGPEVLERLRTTYASDPDVTVEEVECLAACGGAPAMQVNYEFHEQMTPEAAEEIIEEYRVRLTQGAHDLRERVLADQTLIVTKRLHDRPDDSWTIAGAIATGAYEVLREVLRKGDAADVQEQVKLSGLRGRGGAGFPARAEVVVPSPRFIPALSRGQRRRR